MGLEADPSIMGSMGLDADSGRQRYVRELGLRLAKLSERPNLPWTFRVIDDPVVNAFAVPGGYVYVTRGMLAYVDNEAELAGVMGHEVVGRLEQVGRDVSGLAPGVRVVVEPNYSYGQCHLCREGNRNLCLARTAVGIDVDGGFAELVRLPSRCCWPAPAHVDDEDLLVTEPLAVVVRAVNRGAPRPGESAAIIGAGTLGLLALQVLRARGVRVLVVSRTHRRFALARELGAEQTWAVAVS